MNFLERLVAEWYSYQEYFVRTNIKFGKRAKGGYTGEMDVVAFHPKEKRLIHIETSMDAYSWAQRKKKFQKKFKDATSHYNELFDFPIDKIDQIAIVGFGKPKVDVDFGDGVKIISIPDFMIKISSDLSNKHPLKNAIPQEYPLLRAIQFSAFWGKPIKLKNLF
ncbi:MAG: hypothetical protein GXO65_06050 [Euryarchaeota archaeon]|nr:hypothetical protein [Euryarchaeota archaeon]